MRSAKMSARLTLERRSSGVIWLLWVGGREAAVADREEESGTVVR